MINSGYRQKEIESNHENYHTDGEISRSKAVNAVAEMKSGDFFGGFLD